MVIVKKWIQGPTQIKPLTELVARFCIFGYPNSQRHPTVLELIGADGATMHLRAKYNDVRPKFECYYVKVEPGPLFRDRQLEYVPSASSSLRILIGCSWERPAHEAELPPHYEQIVGEEGKRHCIPRAVEAIGLYVRGFAFWDAIQNKAIAAIVASHDVPGTLDILSDKSQLDPILDACEVVPLNDLSALLSDIEAWIRTFESQSEK